MKNAENIFDELDYISDEAKEMAAQIIKTFSEKGFTHYAAKETLGACKLLLNLTEVVFLKKSQP